MQRYIDHTCLKLEANQTDIQKACEEALEFRFQGLCVRREWLELLAPRLKGTGVLLVTVIGFPSGAESTEQKVEETRDAGRKGADEIDMVLNRRFLQAADYDAVYRDISAVVHASQGRLVKVILETSELTDTQKVSAATLSVAAGARFVKTSTGFSSGGATVADVALLRKVVGPEIGVKASGGIRSREDAEKMIAAGANRLGTSASVAIVRGPSAGTANDRVGY